ncbi:DASS family sodium-coupled anion symporter [Mannheimia sp. AT1]|uniref:DASS family sodium-coupled anion symporter n=1 Tax=Mannheimia cairinae TaxID=3025936 RepID=A0ABT5MLR4_9PAST|nr:DASS family sodium-coupled anion symporter [Mannheimia cairinae]MDD0823129.1 DASS family sodium-coupled anion symporter [Mannheimia cairinae]MDD0825846.1 DASS family sodium-coupled anion symporter [Mannheimia cairinae]
MTNSPALNKIRKDRRDMAIFLVDVALFFALLKWLPFEPEPTKGLALLAFVAVLWLTEAVHVTVTALFVPVLAIGLGLVTSKEALIAFADPTIFLFFGGFALATALHIQKLDKMIANKIMALANGKLFVAVLYLFIVTAFLSMWMSNTATAAMMLPLALGILSKMDKVSEHNTYTFVLLGIAYSAGIGGMGTLVGSPPNAIVASQLHLSFSQWLMYGLPMMLLLLPLVIFILYLNFKPKFKGEFQFEFEQIGLNKNRIITLIIFIFIACCWILGGKLNPLLSQFLGLKTNIGSFDSIIALAASLLLCVTKVVSWKQIQEGTEWGVLFLFGGGLTLSAVLSHTGASRIMAEGIVALIEGKHYFIICLIIAAFIVVLTEFTSNTASAALLVPIFISIAEALNMNPLGFALIIGLGASCAFMLPVGTPPNAIIYGTGLIRQRDMLKSYKMDLLCMLIIATAGYLFWL